MDYPSGGSVLSFGASNVRSWPARPLGPGPVAGSPAHGQWLARLWPRLRRAAQQPVPERIVSVSQPTVLVIDDDRTICTITERVLASMGFQSLSATDAVEGVALFRDHLDEIACTLLDVTMPGRGVADTLSELRSADAGAPVVLITGHDVRDVTERVPPGSVSGVLQKPFDPEQLRSLLNRVMRL